MLRRAEPADVDALVALARLPEVAGTIATDAAGGIAAVRELVERLFGEHAVHRIEPEVYGFNLPAQRVFERAGFVREGVRRRAYDRAGDRQDGIRYGLLSGDRR